MGPFATNINGVSIHPTDSGTLYAATGMVWGAGVFKSTDAGASWRPLWNGLPKDTEALCVEVDRTRPDVIYAGIHAGVAPKFAAVYRSTDAGAHWTRAAEGIPYAVSYVWTIVSDPTRPGTVFAGTSWGVYRSVDWGSRWTLADAKPAFRAPIYTIALDPAGSGIMFAGGYDGLFKSTDAGATWRQIKKPPLDRTIIRMAMHPLRPDTIFAAPTRNALFKSTDGGRTWETIALPELDIPYEADGLALDVIGTVLVVYVASHSLIIRSTDGGASWEVMGDGLPPDTYDLFDLTVDPLRPGTIYVATDWGLYKSETQGRTWRASHQGIVSTSVSAMALEPATTPVLYAPLDPEFPRSLCATSDLGRTWEWVSEGLKHGPFFPLIATAPGCPGTIYYGGWDPEPGLVNKTVVFKSEDRGETWSRIFSQPAPRSSPASVMVDPVEPDRVYVTIVGEDYPTDLRAIFKSEDAGMTWSKTSPLPDKDAPYTMAIDPRETKILYVASYDRLWKSTDRGVTWSESDNGLPGKTIITLLIDPDDTAVLYAATQYKGVYTSLDAGGQWFRVDQDGLPNNRVEAVAIDPHNADTLYAGTFEKGLYKSADGGVTWRSINSGLRSWWIMSILVDPVVPGRIFVGTGGTGIFMSTTGGE